MNSYSERATQVLGSSQSSKTNSGEPELFKISSNWIYEAKFDNKRNAHRHLMAEEIWYSGRTYSVQGGRKIHYHCNRAKLNETQCCVMKCLICPNDSNVVFLYKTKTKHKHDKTNKIYQNGVVRKNDNLQLGTDLKLRIIQLMKEIQSPKTIMLQLEEDGFDLDDKEFLINNFVLETQNTFKWILEDSFDVLDEAKSYLKRQKVWNFKFHSRSSIGMDWHYRCNLVPKIGPQCAARKYFSVNKATEMVTLYKSDCPHTHKDIITTLNSIGSENTIDVRFDDTSVSRFTEMEVENDSDFSMNNIAIAERMECSPEYQISINDCGPDTSDIVYETNNLPLRFNEIELIPDSYPNSNIIVKEEVTINDETIVTTQPVPSLEETNPCALPAESIDIFPNSNILVKGEVIINDESLPTYQPFDSITMETNPYEAEEIDSFLNSNNILEVNIPTVYTVNNENKSNSPPTDEKHIMYSDKNELNPKPLITRNHFSIPRRLKPKSRNRKICYKQKTKLLKELQIRDQKTLIEQGFKILKAVNLRNCLNHPENYETSSNDTNFEFQIKEEQPLFTSEWVFERKFPNEQIAIDYLAKDDDWIVDITRDYAVKGGRKVHYRCNRTMINEPHCAASKCLLYAVDSNEISLFKHNSKHTHDAIAVQFRIKRKPGRPPKYGHGNSLLEKDQINDDHDSLVREQTWAFEKSFGSNKEAFTYLKRTNWSAFKNTKIGRISHFRCNLVKNVGPQCDAKKYLVRSLKTNKFLVYRNLAQHTHNQIITMSATFIKNINKNKEISLRSRSVAKEYTYDDKCDNQTMQMKVDNINDSVMNSRTIAIDKQIETGSDNKNPNMNTVATNLNKESNEKQNDIVDENDDELTIQTILPPENVIKPITPPTAESDIVDSDKNKSISKPSVARNNYVSHYKIRKKTYVKRKFSTRQNALKFPNAVMEKTEKLLGIWIEYNTQRNILLTEMEVLFKAKTIFGYLKKTKGRESHLYFHPSRGWLRQFLIRNNHPNIEMKSKIPKDISTTARENPRTVTKLIEEGKYLPEQVFSVVETTLFWKRLPDKTFITKQEKSAPGDRVEKERLTLLLGYNAAGDFKLKPLLIYYSENPRVLDEFNKTKLPIIWISNKNAWLNSNLFEDWLQAHFSPAVQLYLETKNIANKALLLLDRHPKYFSDLFYLSNVTIEYLPKKIAALYVKADEGLISTFKAYYLRRIYKQLIGVTDKRDCIIIKEFWNKYNILDAINNIEKSWEEIKPSTLNHIWTYIWPANDKRKIKGHIGCLPKVAQSIVKLGNQLGFVNMNNSDVFDWIKSHRETLSIENLLEMEEHIYKTKERINETEIRDALEYIEKGLKMLCDMDSEKQRSLTVSQKVNEAIYCYKELYQKQSKTEEQ